ncbi:C1 family peptidase [Bifidobacterium sp. ESL0728]|uniref:aminopeptidase C n=1 Tax=Bifidobacterium sp. ESL0728 TaxID=2983220 RepID=UPI0023F6D710|nr:C1 family peptidase [Bifidobacterium sp. ESL0728]WEV60024.1 C1 family peptidase [Bifidobacterium sp. ESL0728]
MNKIDNTKAISAEDVRSYSENYNTGSAARANHVAANAAVKNGVIKAATSYEGTRELTHDFSIELKQGTITDQQRSGRCWMFASLNTLRYELMHRWKLEDFEFSETYLFFWDKFEKSNTYLENVLDTLDEPTDSRTFEAINAYPADDGGWWQMFVNLVNKYGLVPKSAYPESQNSKDSDAFTQYLTTKLHQFAIQLRQHHENGKSMDELREFKKKYMEDVYGICAISLGEPPAKFDWLARVKDGDDDDKDSGGKSTGNKEAKTAEAGKADSEPDETAKNSGDSAQLGNAATAKVNNNTDDTDAAKVAASASTGAHASKSGNASDSAAKTGENQGEAGIDERKQIVEHDITPLEFYHKYVPVDVNDFVTLCNNPMKSRPFYTHFQLKYSTNVAETGNLDFTNVPIDVLRKAAVDQVKAGHPIWFACDCMQYCVRDGGYFSKNAVRVDELFGTDFSIDKANGLEYGDYPSNHAMTITGVNLDESGKPNRWKIENSWGKSTGTDGYYVADGEWFDQFVTEVIIRKEFLDDKTLKTTQAEPVILDPWQIISARCD